jgi:beta-glucanase (GH16 family)
LPDGKALSADFHVFTVVWDEDALEFQIDRHTYKRVAHADLPPGTQWVYNHPFFLILNLAVGGNWPGNPDATTRFPQRMVIDWVRIYARDVAKR